MRIFGAIAAAVTFTRPDATLGPQPIGSAGTVDRSLAGASTATNSAGGR